MYLELRRKVRRRMGCHGGCTHVVDHHLLPGLKGDSGCAFAIVGWQIVPANQTGMRASESHWQEHVGGCVVKPYEHTGDAAFLNTNAAHLLTQGFEVSGSRHRFVDQALGTVSWLIRDDCIDENGPGNDELGQGMCRGYSPQHHLKSGNWGGFHPLLTQLKNIAFEIRVGPIPMRSGTHAGFPTTRRTLPERFCDDFPCTHHVVARMLCAGGAGVVGQDAQARANRQHRRNRQDCRSGARQCRAPGWRRT